MGTEFTSSPLTLSQEAVPAKLVVSRPIGTILCLLTSDSVAIVLALFLAAQLRTYLIDAEATPVASLIIPALLVTLCSSVGWGLYPGVCENPVEELRRTFCSVSLAFTCLGASSFFLHDISQSRLTFLFGWMLATALIPAMRSLVRSTFANRPWWGSPVVILGAGITGKRLLHTLCGDSKIGLRPVAVLDDNPDQYADIDEDLIRGPLSRSLDLSREHRISYAIICMPGLSRKDLLQLMDKYGHCFGHVMVVPNLIGMASLGVNVKEIGGVIGLEVTQKLLLPGPRFAKRALDLILTIAAAPLVLLVVAIAMLLIKLESAGPVLIANERIGMNGRKFKAWKLRSMVVNGDDVLEAHFVKHPEDLPQWQATQKLKRDPRVTRVGRIIRKTSIDELPQLWNVLIGEMSVVGPRPMLESQVAMYGPAFESYKRVRPGITGLWQISGRNHLTFAERARLDAYTIRNWSVWLDVYILIRTVSVVLTAHGAY
jgi:Undecaprenyl-phosphate galactose phosphotransferase WbaP